MSEYDNRPLRVMARKTTTCNICYTQIDKGDRLCKLGPLLSCGKHEEELIELFLKTKNRVRQMNRTITDDQVREIRRLWATGDYTQVAVAERVGASYHATVGVIHRKSFRDIE